MGKNKEREIIYSPTAFFLNGCDDDDPLAREQFIRTCSVNNGSEIIYTITITVSSSENEISLSIFGGFATTATTTVNGIFITITNQKKHRWQEIDRF